MIDLVRDRGDLQLVPPVSLKMDHEEAARRRPRSPDPRLKKAAEAAASRGQGLGTVDGAAQLAGRALSPPGGRSGRRPAR